MNEAGERDALYQAIMDSWEEDTPRLIYADWLDERGDTVSRNRAELIRVQCGRARQEPLTEPPSKEMYVREREAEDAVRADLASCGLGAYHPLETIRFHRGFITPWQYPEENGRKRSAFLAVPPEAWTILGPVDEPGYLFDQYSPRALEEFAELATSPALRYWRSIRVGKTGEKIGEANFVALISSPHISNVRKLEVVEQTRAYYEDERYPLGERAVSALAGNPSLSRLSSVTIWWAGLDDAALCALASSEYLRNIRHLSLADHFTDRGVIALTESPIIQTIESLHLNGQLTGTTLDRLMRSELKNLHTLDLSGFTSGIHEHDSLHYGDLSRALDPTGFRALLNSPLLTQLKVLKLCPANGNADAEQLANAADRMPALERLDLDDSCGGEVLAALRRRFAGKLFFWGQPDSGN